MNAPFRFKQSRAVLALASLGFALGAWLAPDTALAQQRPEARNAPPAQVTTRGSVTARKPGDTRAAYGGSTCEWDGTQSAWSSAARWSCGRVPTTADEAVITDGRAILDVAANVSHLRLTGGSLEVYSDVAISGPLTQTGGNLRVYKDGLLRFPNANQYLQQNGTLMIEVESLSRFGRMDFSNGIGGIGTYGLAGRVLIAGANGFVPGDSDEFLLFNGSSMSTITSGYIPNLQYQDFPNYFGLALGVFEGRLRNLYPGACRWIGGYSVFGNPTNWSCGHVPTASDTAILDAAQVELNGSFTVGRLITRNYPRLFGFGNTLTALGQPQRNELTGYMDLSQNLVLALGDSFADNAHFSLYGQSAIVNQGHFSATGGSLQFDSGAGGVIHNAPGATMDLKLNVLFFYGGDIELLNEGEIVLNTPQQGSIFTLEVQDGARIRQTQGRFVLNDVVGNYFEPPATFQLEGGEFMGNGRFDFPMNNVGGIVRPGLPASCGGGGEADAASRASVAAFTAPSGCSSPGYLEFLGYTQGPEGTLELQLGAGGDDDFSVTGPASLAGKLSLRDLNGLRPEFDLNLFFGFPVTGAFTTFDSDFGPDYTLEYRSNTVILKFHGTPPVRIAPLFTSAPAPSTGKVGVAYAHTFTASGTPAPTFFAGSTLPPGLALASNGELSGTPLRPDTYSFDVLADNGVEPFATQPVTLVVALGDAAEIVTVAGTPQSAVVGAAFGTRLRAVVRDFGGNAVPGVSVNFTAPPSGASAILNPATATSDANGEVSAAAIATGGTGTYTATASAPGVPGAAAFELTNVGTAQSAIVGTTVPTVNYGEAFRFNIRAVDMTGNPLPSGRASVFVSGIEVCSVDLPDTRCDPQAPIEPGVRDVRAVLSAPLHTAPDFLSTIFIGAHTGSMVLDAPAGATLGTPLGVTATLKYLFDHEEILPGTLPPTGVIEIKRSGVTVCSAPVTARDSSITCQLPIATQAPFTLSAEYAGDVHYQPVSKSQTVIVANTGEGYNVGDLAPDFTVHDHLGNPRTLREFLGKNVLLDFCAAWCGPCQQMGYDAGAIRQTFAGNNFEYVTIVMQDPSQQVSTIADAREWLSEHPFFGPTMHLNGDANPSRDVNLFHFGVNPTPAFPTLVMLGPDQRIRTKQIGSMEAGEVRDLVADALGIPRPIVASRLVTSGLTQAGIEVRVNGQLVLDSGPIAPTGGSFQFSGNGLTVELTTEGVKLPPYDEHVVAFVARAGGFGVGDVIGITLKNIAFADGFARFPGANGTLNGATLTLAPETITPANTTGLETGVKLDLDFLNAGPAPGTPPAITSAAPPATGQVGVSYQHQYVATGTGPIVFSLATGALPSGVTISNAGLLSGTPTSVGTFTGSVRAVGAAAPEATQAFSIAIAPAAPVLARVTVSKTGLGTGRVVSTPSGIDCGATCAADFVSGSPVQLAATADAGSRFDGWSGACSGTGSCAFTPSGSTSLNALFSLLPPPPTKPVFTSGAPANGRAGVAYQHVFTASGTSPITFSLGSGTLPPGLTLTNDGILSGSPTIPGTFGASISASNAGGSAGQPITITIDPAAQTRLEIAGGNHQSAFYNRARLTGDAFPAPLRVRVLDPSGAGIKGQRVEFVSLSPVNAAGPRADLSAQSVTTDDKGEASVIATAANGLGPHRVRASVPGLGPVFFDLTNLARAVGVVELAPILRTNHETPVLAPFFSDIAVALVSKLDSRAPVPGREVRFYVPFDPNGTKASAVLEGAGSGRLTAAESTRPDDGFYRLYATAISGDDSIARVEGFANSVVGSYDVIAVLVNEGDPLDPMQAKAGQRLSITLENLPANLGVRLTPLIQQQAKALEAYPEEIKAVVFDAAMGPSGGIPGAEAWIFAGDDARGEPGATIVAPDGIEGRLAGGERYTALTVDVRGGARFTAVANRYKGLHKITVAYPGSYATLKEAPIQAFTLFLNTTGATPDGGTGEGPSVASLEIVSGDFQRIVSSSKDAFAFPLVVRARDAAGKPLANALVRFVPIATFVGTRVTVRSSAVLTDSSVLTDANGLASVGARPDGEGQSEFKVRASAEGAEPVSFTLRLTGQAESDVQLSGVPRSSGRTSNGFIGQDQSQVTLARFDEPLSVVAGSISARRAIAGMPVRFYYPVNAFEPEGGTPGVFIDSNGKQHPYVTLVADGSGGAALRGLAGPNAAAFDVIALLPDASPSNDNDAVALAAKQDPRTFVFNLRNVAPGVTLTLEQGSFQGVQTGQPFFRTLKVRALPASPDPATGHAAPGLDGADLWFMSPTVTDDTTPAAVLVGGDVHTIVDSGGRSWRVVAIPIADDGLVEVGAIANDVRGTHRIIAAYPGNFTDPTSAPFQVTFFLCNGQPRSAPCSDPVTTPGSIELVDAGPLFTFNSTPPPLRVRVKNQLGQLMAGTSVGFFASGAGVTGTSPYVHSGAFFTAGFPTDANGIANGAPGLSFANASQEYTVTAGAGNLPQVTLRFTRYAAPSTITPVGPIVSAVFPNTLHRALQVTTPNPAPIEWTVLPGPSGASATFAGGSLVARDIQVPTRPGAVIYTLPALTANGTAGTFTLKATIIGTSATATFAMVNLAPPASIARSDAGTLYTFSTQPPPLRVLVRGSSGAPLAGIPVLFVIGAGSTVDIAAGTWARVGTNWEKVVATGSDGIADGRDGLSLRDIGSYFVTAGTTGLPPVSLPVDRYNIASSLVIDGPATSAALVGQSHAALRAIVTARSPVRWTIQPGPGGASGTFSNGTGTIDSFPGAGGGPVPVSQVVTANAIIGAFTVRARAINSIGTLEVVFTLSNLATAPASVAPADPEPRYSYSGTGAPIRAVVRNAAGQPVAGVPVTFTANGAFDYATGSPWIRTGSGAATTRVVTTGADGIADATSGITVRDSYSPQTIRAAVQGVTDPARIEIIRFNLPSTVRVSGAASSIAVINTAHATLKVEMGPQVPIRWTVIASANGAGGTFPGGASSLVTFPSIGGVTNGAGTGFAFAVVTANGVAGTFTLRAQPADFSGFAPVDFTLVNLITAPATIVPADPAPRYTYGGASPPIRALVRGAGGQPLAGIPVTFTASGAFDIAVPGPWTRNSTGSVYTRVVVTGADGIADATGNISIRDSYSPETIRAAVQGVTDPAQIEVIRFNPASTLRVSGAASSIAVINTAHATMKVEMGPQVPIRWTVIAGANGAGGTFPGGASSLVTFPPIGGVTNGAGTGLAFATVTANGVAGTFTLRAQPADFPGFTPVAFTLVNLVTAPATVAPADPAPSYTYSLASPPIRAVVRDAAGQALAGIPVTFTASGAFDIATPSPWIRSAPTSSIFTRVVLTGADGIADASGGIGLRNSYSSETILAAVQGVAQPARMEVVRYNPPSRVTAFGPTTSVAVIDTHHAEMRVEMAPQVPIRWTILTAPNGASGTFADGSTKIVTFPGGLGVGYSSAIVKANGITGTFTVQAQPQDGTGVAPVAFTLTNLSALPHLVERVDGGTLFTYTAAAPALRVVVRDSNGAPIAGVPVKFEAEGDMTPLWQRVGGLNVRTFITNAAGIADGSQFLTSSHTYTPNQVSASVPGVSRAATMAWFHYLPVDQIDPVDGLIYTGAPGAQHIVRVRVDPPVPLRWTVVASAGGAGGAFLTGERVLETFPTGTSSAAQTMQLAVRSNAIRGVYTVKVEPIGIDGPAVVIAVVNE